MLFRSIDGVWMTPDHEVLTKNGWQAASQLPRPYRPEIRLPNSYSSFAYGWEKMALGLFMRMWQCSDKGRVERSSRIQESWNPKLWLYDLVLNEQKSRAAWYEQPSSVLCMGLNEAAVTEQKQPSL